MASQLSGLVAVTAALRDLAEFHRSDVWRRRHRAAEAALQLAKRGHFVPMGLAVMWTEVLKKPKAMGLLQKAKAVKYG